jgi:hypothetical protein
MQKLRKSLCVLAVGAVCALGLGCGADSRTPNRPEPGPADASAPESGEAKSEGPADAGPDAELSAEDKAVQEMVSELGSSEPQSDEAQHGLVLRVLERGPDLPWILAIVNRGPSSYRVAAHASLLSFTVRQPGKKTATTCELPASARPSLDANRQGVALAPGEALVEAIDPTLYCFSSDLDKNVLVADAVVEPYFGFRPKMRVRWVRGKKVDEPHEKQAPPFMASTLGGTAPDAGNARAEVPPIKGLAGTPLTLGAAYAAEPTSDTRSSEDQQPLALTMEQGSDADSMRTATVSVALRNRSKSRVRVFFRRELLTFEVRGPSGTFTCDPKPDARSPDPSAFTALAPGGTITAASRLVELCEPGSFSQPGVYMVHARFEATASGSEHGLEAFVGRVLSKRPARVRIRRGDHPGMLQGSMQRVRIER